MVKEILFGREYEWDEESINVSHNITNRSACLKHKWINASLRFEKKVRTGIMSVNIEERHDDEYFGRKWGGRGGIRYCEKCKLIDCIHFWKEPLPDDESWKSCDHRWVGGLHRAENNNGAEWICLKCGAAYRFMCGHGGSLYVCDECYKTVTERMVREYGTIENGLSKHCFAPRHPIIRECIHCERRIRIL